MLYPNGSRTRPAVSSPFGPRRGGAFSVHYGADLVGYSIVRAAGPGKVTFAGWMNSAAGNTIIIDLGGGVSEVHMHLASFSVKRGDRLTEGYPLGRMGRTGNASGNCDHFEIRVNGTSVDPLAYTAARITPPPAPAGETTAPPKITEDTDMQTIQWGPHIFTVGTGYLKHETSTRQAAIMGWLFNRNDRMMKDSTLIGVDNDALNALQKSLSIPWYAFELTMSASGYNIDGTRGNGQGEEGRVWSLQHEINAKLDGIRIDTTGLAQSLEDLQATLND